MSHINTVTISLSEYEELLKIKQSIKDNQCVIVMYRHLGDGYLPPTETMTLITNDDASKLLINEIKQLRRIYENVV